MPLIPKKGKFRISKNFKGITLLNLQRFIIPCFSIIFNPKLIKFFGKTRMAFKGIVLQPHIFWQFESSEEYSRECHSNTTVCKFLQGIWFHTPRKDRPVSWGCEIHWLHLCRGSKTSLTSILDMTLNNLIVRSFRQWSVPLLLPLLPGPL